MAISTILAGIESLRLSTSITGLLAAYIVFTSIRRHLRRRHLPPGPYPFPLVGNAFQAPLTSPWLRFTQWGNKYGPIVYFEVLGQQFVVLNTHQAAQDLLERRSSLYSDRPHLFMMGEVLTDNMFMVVAKYGEKWRKMRRAMHDNFSSKSVQMYQPVQAVVAERTVVHMLADARLWGHCIKQSTISAILSVVYGMSPSETEDAPLLKRLKDHVEFLVQAATPGQYLVEFVPAMKYLPTWLAPWKRKGIEWHKTETEMLEKLFADALNRTSAGESDYNFVGYLGSTRDKYALSTKEAAWLSSQVLGAGADTTSSTLQQFVLAMVLHPEIMRKAQAEIDVVVGRERAPNFDDYGNLPYVHAIIKEVLRWRPPLPLGVGHRVTQDDWYNGYFIPRGAGIITNIWAMNQDPEFFPDFEEFRPERFLDESLKGKLDTLGHISFGFGRRICPGIYLADQALFITIAVLLWAADISPAVDENGKYQLPSATAMANSGLVSTPAPFTCSITPRFPEAMTILESRAEK